MEKYKYANQTVILKDIDSLKTPEGDFRGKEFRAEDYWINFYDTSWMFQKGNPACMIYAMRSGFARLPIDNNVIYGKIGGLGWLIHESEIEGPKDGKT